MLLELRKPHPDRKIMSHYFTFNAISLIILLLISSSAFAGDATYLNVNLASYHFSRDAVEKQSLSEINPGIGIERDAGGLRQMVGVYRNSIRRTSVYALAGYVPLRIDRLRMGVVGGAITGYEIPVAPAVGLLASLQFNHYGVNIIIVPDAHVLRKEVHGFAGLQFRCKLK